MQKARQEGFIPPQSARIKTGKIRLNGKMLHEIHSKTRKNMYDDPL